MRFCGRSTYFDCLSGDLQLFLLIISVDGFSFETNFTAVAATLNNIGPGLDQVGPTSNFFGYGPVSKLILIF